VIKVCSITFSCICERDNEQRLSSRFCLKTIKNSYACDEKKRKHPYAFVQTSKSLYLQKITLIGLLGIRFDE
jgi:hypothetical protein